MALTSTAATVYISRKNIPSSAVFTLKPSRLLVRSSGDLSAEIPITETQSPEKSIDAPKGSPSLISALNVERAVRGIAITDVDHYGVLGLPRDCSNEQVPIRYKNRVDELLNRGLDEEQVGKEMEVLKASYEILSSKVERRLYDWSLARSEQPDKYVWPYEVDVSVTPYPGEPPMEPEDTGPTRLVGYFFLAWVIIAFALSITLNRL